MMASMHVVLIDPSRTVLKFIRRMLDARDYEVRSFVDGREALDYIKSDPDVKARCIQSEEGVNAAIVISIVV